MKYILILSLLYGLTCQAQIVTIPEAAEPIMAFGILGSGPSVRDTFFIDYSSPDTFENKLWDPIYWSRRGISSGEYAPGFPKFAGHRRVEDKKTFFREDKFFVQREGLMYDFDVDVGDSIWVLSPSAHPLGFDSVYHVFTDVVFSSCTHSDSVKVIYTSAMYNYPDGEFFLYDDIWVEGIGSLWHGLFPIACLDEATPNCEERYIQYYLFIDGQWIEPRDILCEEIPTSTTNINRKPLQTLVSPNPVHKNGLLTIEAIDYRLDRVAVFDISGRQLMDVFSDNPQLLQLDLAGLGSGIYVVKLYSKSGAVDVKKVVVR